MESLAQFLKVQELPVNWDTVIAKDSHRPETVSDGDCEHSA